ncbi:MAG: N-6 DNA methylase, partial [Planctomycetes bacterium]|nr:N-6 DNA methylase [Planctomycetota bacterium]
MGHFEEKTSCKALVPENLVTDFGANTHVSRQFVSSLYHSLFRLLDDGDQSLAAMQFEQWRALFGAVAGFDESSNHLRDKRSFRKFARSMGIDRIDVNPPFLVFAVHTYYALLTKLIAYHALARFDSSQRTRFNLLCELSNGELKHELAELERGSIFRTLGLRNFLERDSFSWYLESWGNDTTRAVRLLLGRLKNYDAGTLDDSPEQTGDLLKNLYHRTIPREIRHDLGEYYTPDWLAEHTLNQLGYEGQIDRRLLDPSCGSGTFLVLAIRRLRKTCFNEGLNKQETLEAILNNIVGIDLNPLAVLAARANYVLALGDLFADRTQDISPPIHLADSILDPYDEQTLSIGDFDYVAGNPPWVGWESLPDDYRHRTQPLWEQYGLFPHGGMATILGQGKKDLSMLMSYAVTDHFIKSGGKLGFVVTQSVFKTSGASQGFRRFRFGNRDDQVVRVNSVDDLTDFQAFEGASNRTAVFVWTKGEK